MRVTDWLAEALSGPFRFRLVVQPLVALLLGVRDGRSDHARGEAPFVLGILLSAGARGERLLAALRQIATPLFVAVALDAVAQLSIHGTLRPLAALWVGALLIALPYVLARGLTNRILRHPGPGRVA